MSQKREESFENRILCFLLLLPVILGQTTNEYSIKPRIGYDAFIQAPADNGTDWWHLYRGFDLASAYSQSSPKGRLRLRWTYTPATPPKPDSEYDDSELGSAMLILYSVFMENDSVIQCSESDLSEVFCQQQYYCLFHALLGSLGRVPDMTRTFRWCVNKKFNMFLNHSDYTKRECHIYLSDFSSNAGSGWWGVGSCGSVYWQLTQENWQAHYTDECLQTALQGGVDHYGVYWEGRREGETFAEALGRQLWNINGNTCTIKNPCEPVLDCTKIGSFTAVGLGNYEKPMRTPWALSVSSALKNINRQLRNQYNELKDAIESLALDTFSIDDFFPKKSQDFALQNSLAGIGGLFSILGGFVPVAGPAIAAAGTIASGVGTFMANSIAASSDPLEAQKVFSQKVLDIYNGSLHAMDDLVEKLFAGDPIPGPGPGSFTILDMMRDGAWINPKALSKVSDLNSKLRIEALSRSIDSLWKTRTSNKMWVLFTDLGNDPTLTTCNADGLDSYTNTMGPPDSKYCADGGVYYTYNFIERSNGRGGVGWLWGADKLQPKAGISLKWVTEASAKSYRLMKEIRQDPFSFNHTLGTAAYLAKAFTAGENQTDLSTFVGRYPGSWTLPVCDASTWG
ncbi:MAG: hypothetical protein Q9184_005863 [Pyrenodesmia sp. 2 TL-2023]